MAASSSDGRPFIPVWLAAIDLTANELRVYLSLWSRGNPCWPAAETIAADCRIATKTVWKCLKALEARGLVKRGIERRSEGRTSNTYRLFIPTDHQSLKRTSDRKGLVTQTDFALVPSADQGLVPLLPHKGTKEKVRKEDIAAGQRPRDPVFDALASVDGSNPLQLTKPAAKACAVALAAIRSVSPDVDSAEIQRRAAVYRSKNPTWTRTPHAIAKHWASLAGANGHRPTPAACLVEPDGWRELFRSADVGASFLADPREWKDRSLDTQRAIIEAAGDLAARQPPPIPHEGIYSTARSA